MKHLDHPTKLDWSKLPPSFRRIRLELAREKGHPQGSASFGYTFDAPLIAAAGSTQIYGTNIVSSAALSGFARTKRMMLATSSASKEAPSHFATISKAIRKRKRAITSAPIVLCSETMYRFGRTMACAHFRSRLWSRSERRAKCKQTSFTTRFVQCESQVY
jgi:hypothetical protein